MAPITHLVIFAYLPSLSDAERHLIASRFLALQDACEYNGQRYLAVTGGKNNSTEGVDKGFEHAFVVTFDSVEARDYYVAKDPAHDKFKEQIKDQVADVLVLDFEAGVF